MRLSACWYPGPVLRAVPAPTAEVRDSGTRGQLLLQGGVGRLHLVILDFQHLDDAGELLCQLAQVVTFGADARQVLGLLAQACHLGRGGRICPAIVRFTKA